jgi:hypothetical protein
MHETQARAALLLAAIEADRGKDGASPLPDRAPLDRATCAATTAPPGSEAWIGTRTRLGWAHLLPTGDPGSAPARAWLDRSSAIGSPILVAMALAFLLGAGVDRLAGAPYLRLVEPAIWVLILFNLGAYLLLAAGAFGLPASRAGAIGGLAQRPLGRLTARASAPPTKAFSRIATPETLAGFAREWGEASASLDAARIRAVLHASAAALAAGVIAGLYARGLTTDYAVGWESTFLDADAMHAWVHVLLGPAAMLSGLPLPDRDTVAAWRVLPGGAPTGGGAAAVLIHLHALSLVLAVVLPRAALAALAWRRALRLRRDFPLPERLRTPVAAPPPPSTHLGRLVLITHGAFESARADSLLAALPHAGDAGSLQVMAGDEESAALPTEADTVLLLSAMTATPEAEAHGRLLARLRLALPTARLVLVVDSEPFERRFGAWPARVAERRAAWQSFAGEAGVALATLDLASADGAAWRAALARALADSDDDTRPPR